ncbi:MAG: hypothetical protein KF746_14675 [Chitinophagaceae bacterium]|nr:hypothetical protein [Chitinophagaceae bacterium]
MKVLLLTFLFSLSGLQYSIAQASYKNFYLDAFNEQLQMLRGEKPIDFKRAVFITENAYHKGKLNYESFCTDINQVAIKLKGFIKERGFERYKTAGNWAVFTYMTDSLPINSFKPYTYDFDDFMGDKDFSKMFVTKLLRTKSGNCHSLPTLYKILCEEIDTKASLALAPNHLYIKHIDENGQWTNLELTNGGFPRDQWLIKEMAITVEAIKSEIYMKPLSQKESIALTMQDLINEYVFQFGYDSFVLKVANTALSYFPKCVPLLMSKANYYKHIGEADNARNNPDMAFSAKNHALYQKTLNTIDSLGYKEMPTELYQEWVKSVEKEKAKRAVLK